MSTPETPDSLHFKDYWQVIRSRAGIILTLIVIVVLTGYVVTEYFLVKKYLGSTAVQVFRQNQTRDIEVFSGADRQYYDPVFFQSQIELMESVTILNPIIAKLDLKKTWSARYLHGAGELTDNQVYEALRSRKHLKIEQRRGSNVLDINVTDEEAPEAAKIANAIAAEYINYRTSSQEYKVNRGLDTLRDQIHSQEASVTAATQKVEEIRTRDNIDLVSGGQLSDQELMRKQEMLDTQRSDTVARQVQYDKLKALSPEELIDTLPTLGLSDDTITQLRQQQISGQTNIQSLLKDGHGADHPKVQALQATVDEITRQLTELAKGKKTALEIDLAASQERLRLLQADVEALRNKVRSETTGKIVPYNDAAKDRDRQQMLLDQLNIRFKQESVENTIQDEPARVITPADINPNAVSPILLLNLLLSFVAGLILALSVAFFIEYLDTSVKTISDVERALGIPVLGIVPKGTKPLNQEEPDSPHAESYRILHARIDLQAGANGGNTITVLSGNPGEGKSTTLFNLGFVSAQAGQPTVIMDCDLRRPSLHDILGIPLSTGVADYLRAGEEASIANYIQATSIPNLHVILAGNDPAPAKILFNGAALRRALDHLKQLYQVVLVDSPPALGISDASVIAHEVDKTVLVIQHRRYPRDVSIRAKRAIEDVQGNLVGVVLNNVALNSNEGYYYYSAYADYYNKPQASPRRGRSKKSKNTAANGTPSASGQSDEY